MRYAPSGPVGHRPNPRNPALTVPEWALGYAWDIVLRGRGATVFEQQDGDR